MICFDLKWFLRRYGHQISTACKMSIISFSQADFHKFRSIDCLLVKARGLPSRVSTSPILMRKASHYRTKILVKYGIVRMEVEHMEFFKKMKAFFVGLSQLKKFFCSSLVKGPTIFPQLWTIFLQYHMRPQNPLRIFKVLGHGQSFISLIFLGSTQTPSWPKIWPIYSTSITPNEHLDFLTNKWRY